MLSLSLQNWTNSHKRNYMFKKIILSLLIAGTGFSSINAQDNIDKCGWYEAQEQLINGNEELREAMEENEKDFNAFVNDYNFATKVIPDTIIIPIVFHIIHNGGSENVSDEVGD